MKPAPNLRHLRYRHALAEHLNFSRAGDTCSATRSTLSAGIRELEIGVIATIGPFLLSRLMPVLRECYRELELGWREDKTAPLLERLRAGRLDTLLMAFPHAVSGLETMVLFEDVYHVVCHADHPLATAAAVSVDELPQLELLLLEKDHGLHAHAIPLLMAAARGKRSNFSATSLHTQVYMVGEGQGAMLLPTIAVEAGLHAGHSSVVVPIAGRTQARQIGLAWRGQSPRASAIRELGLNLQALMNRADADRPAA